MGKSFKRKSTLEKYWEKISAKSMESVMTLELKTFAEMKLEAVTKLILNWLTLNARARHDVEIRMEVTESADDVFKIKYVCDREPGASGKHGK